MPKGKHLKEARHKSVEVENLMRSMSTAVRDELMVEGSEARARILASFDDTLTAIERLAHGLTVQKLVIDKEGNAEEIVYSLPPFWPALKWLADWGRQIVKEGPKTVQEHDIPEDTKKLLREFMQGGPNREAPRQQDGVYQLGDPQQLPQSEPVGMNGDKSAESSPDN